MSLLRTTARRMFELTGATPEQAQADAERVIRLERTLAAGSLTAEQRQDLHGSINIMSVAEAQKLTPNWDWAAYLNSVGAPADSVINVIRPRFMAAFDRALVEHEAADWSAYLRWRYIYTAAPWLSQAFTQTRFTFSSHFSGVKSLRPRADRCLAALYDGMGAAMGDVYLKRWFTPAARRRGEAMVVNLKAAMADRIRTATWMTPQTKAAALAKLAKVKVYLGGPTRVPDYSALPVVRGPFWANVAASNAFAVRFDAAKLRRPTDPGEWYHLPQDYSGGADPARNSFQYPAGKFHPPFFDPAVDDALNYGALGATMAHELTHLFDNQGREYDQDGRVRDWWAPADAAAFKERAELLKQQVGQVRVRGETLNGALTLNENIADLGGLTVAYAALQKELRGKPRKLIDGFTPEQRFFLAWARNFRELSTPEYLKRQVRSGPHSPAEARVNGPLSNMPEFHAAFRCKPGQAMYRTPAERVRIW
jgi:predicted metalloendopeptidase